MFLSGLFSLFQMLFFPGAVFLTCFRQKPRSFSFFIPRLIYTMALSLLINYLLVLLLTSLGIYEKWLVMLIVLAEISFLTWHYWKQAQKPLWVSLENAWQKCSQRISHYLNPDHVDITKHELLLGKLFRLVSFLLAAIALFLMIGRFLSEIGSVFDGWDAVLSWNFWAVNWANGSFPEATHLYPQLIPTNWSLTYVFMGETQIQLFAKAIMPLFPLAILLLMVDMGFSKKSADAFLGVLITYILFRHFLPEELSNGYVDIAVAFFAFLSIDALLRGSESDNLSESRFLLLVGALLASGAVLTKQGAAWMLLIYPLLAFLFIAKQKSDIGKKQLVRWLVISFAIGLLITVPWYLYKLSTFLNQTDTPAVRELVQLSQASAGGGSSLRTILTQLRSLGKSLIFWLILLPAMWVLTGKYRTVILLIILPFTLLWAYVASYDFRNLAIILPFLGLICGLTFEQLIHLGIGLLNRLKFERWSSTFLLLIVTAIIIGSSFLISSADLSARQIARQKQIFDPEKNALLYELVPDFEPDVKILTNYPVDKLPGLEDNQVSFWFDDYATFLYALESDPRIELVFVPAYASADIKAYLAAGVESGKVKLIFESPSWIHYDMYQILR